MNGVDDLKNLRSGLFDLDITEQGIVEKREFLLNQPVAEDAISPTDADKLPSTCQTAKFYRLQTATATTVQNAACLDNVDRWSAGRFRRYE